MGKHANSAAYREWERQQNRKLDEYFGEDEPLTEAERAADWGSLHWERKDDHLAGFHWLFDGYR